MNSKNMIPSNRHLRKVITLCTQHDPRKRPTFEHILQYIENLEYQYALQKNKEFQQKFKNKIDPERNSLRTTYTDSFSRRL
jgi:transcriptional regulatory protein LevR